MVQQKQLRVLIVGGGIGGLSAAVALRLQGHEVEVFEKSSLHTEIGNAVYCAPNCTAVLGHLGIYPETIGGVAHRGFNFLDKHCQSLTRRVHAEEEIASWPAKWWLLARVDLHEALKRRALDPESPGIPVKIHTGSLISKADCETGTIHLAGGGGGGSVVGDVIVGADGSFSKIRASVFGHEVPLVSTGRCCYRLLIPTADLLADPKTTAFANEPELAIQIAAEDRMIFLYQCSEGKMANLAAFVPKSEVGEIKRGLTGYDQSANKKQLMSHFGSFAPAVLRMLDKAPDDSVKLWDLVDMELQPSLIKHKAVLIGDAAHPFLPYMGQGAAQAVEDACALGVVLPLGTMPNDVPRRLELWQRLRKDRAYRVMENTRRRGRGAEGNNGPPQTLEEFTAAMTYCIQHDAWKHAEEAFKAWMDAGAE